jgi:hypothetical protein
VVLRAKSGDGFMAELCVKYFSGSENMFLPKNELGIFNSFHSRFELAAGFTRRMAAERIIRDGPGSSFSIRRSLAFGRSESLDIVDKIKLKF